MSRKSKDATILVLAVVAALSGGPIAAQQANDDSMLAARELITVMRATDQIKQLLPSIMQMLKPVIIQGRPDVEHDVDLVMPVLIEGMSARVSEMVDEMAALYARNFTADEMREITAFYRSPVGQRFLTKMPAVMQESMTMGQAFGQRIAAEMQDRIKEELRKRGHKL
jgi:uncharacterized protein